MKPDLTPPSPGVYVVLRVAEAPPVFLAKNESWPFRGDPTVDPVLLAESWVAGSPAIYIGKAATLRSRIGAYRRHGTGGHSKHWGGRHVWQLADHQELLVCWRACAEGEEPATVEADLIADFRTQYGSRPFANLTK
ncbi:MAG: hypothetical protein M3Q98_05960 [Actinomycetota bacterium]|nr:hypothetical protein [Actinomycetota bacterium]